jgi:hypothetical protein
MHTVEGVFILEVGDMRNSGIRPRPPFSSETCLCADLTFLLGSRLQKLKGWQGEKYEPARRGRGGGNAARRLYVEMIMTIIIVSNHFSRFLVNRSRGHRRTTSSAGPQKRTSGTRTTPTLVPTFTL